MQNQKQTIGIFGGSFNPPHYGHVLACHYSLLRWNLDKIFVIPSYRHPFGKTLTAFTHRVEMAKISMEHLNSQVEILTIEQENETTSYTIDTVNKLQQLYPTCKFHLIIGGDILQDFEKWKDFEKLNTQAPPLVVPRVFNRESLSIESEPGILPDISSTQIRQLINQDSDQLTAYIPLKVVEYIKQNNLYLPESN